VSEQEFSVWQFFSDGTREQVKAYVTAEEAMTVFAN
jgi:hypothetical protein